MEKKLKEKQKKESDEKQNKMKVISNTDGINNMMDVKVTFEKFSSINIPSFEFNIDKPPLQATSNLK